MGDVRIRGTRVEYGSPNGQSTEELRRDDHAGPLVADAQKMNIGGLEPPLQLRLPRERKETNVRVIGSETPTDVLETVSPTAEAKGDGFPIAYPTFAGKRKKGGEVVGAAESS